MSTIVEDFIFLNCSQKLSPSPDVHFTRSVTRNIVHLCTWCTTAVIVRRIVGTYIMYSIASAATSVIVLRNISLRPTGVCKSRRFAKRATHGNSIRRVRTEACDSDDVMNCFLHTQHAQQTVHYNVVVFYV